MRRVVSIGRVKIGGDNPVAVQSMTNTDTRDVDRKSTRLNSSHTDITRMPSSA